MRRHRMRTCVLGVLAGALTLSGCEFHGISSLPLPGGVDIGDNPYTVTVKFEDVTNLVPQSAIKVNNVTVGQVTRIELEGWHAIVTCELRGDVRLPDNAVAKVSQESLLGAKFVRLARPSTAKPQGKLDGGDVIPLSATGRYPEVEEVLSALSLLLSGGGLEQLRTITKELNAVLAGREHRIKDLLKQLNTFVGGLEEQKSEIVRALEGVKRLSAQLREQKKVLADAVDKIGPALKVLNEQQAELTDMLVALGDLGKVATDVIQASRADLLANLRSLEPILRQLAKSGDALPDALELLLTFPFPATTEAAIEGDYVNLDVTADLELDTVLHNLLSGAPYADKVPDEARAPDYRGPRNQRDQDKQSEDRRPRGGKDRAPEPPEPSQPGAPEPPGGGGSAPSAPGERDPGAPEPEEGSLLDLLTGDTGAGAGGAN